MSVDPPLAVRFRADVQGLRAVAVAAVLLDHAGWPALAGGYTGVDVFFVISGFLITAQLLRELRETGRVRLTAFYARRALRILPASLVVLALTALGVLVLVPKVLRPDALGDIVAAALYVPNLVFAARGTDYLADQSPSIVQHFWSLGVEEQFYLVWPTLLALVWLALRGRGREQGGASSPDAATDRARSPRTRTVTAALVAVAVISFVTAELLTDVSQPWAFFSVWSRAWEFAIGALVALAGPVLARRLRGAGAGLLGWAGLAAIVAAALLYDAGTRFPGTAALLPVLGAAAVIAAGWSRPAWGPEVLLRSRPLQFLGLISYSLYLVHWPMLRFADRAFADGGELPLGAHLLVVAAAVPVAWLLYRLVESRMRHSRLLPRERPARALIATGAAGGLVAGLAAVALVVTAALPAEAGPAVGPMRLTAPPIATRHVPEDLTPSLAAADEDNPVMYRDGCQLRYLDRMPHPCSFGRLGGPRMVLFGDSHAAEWQPALERVARDRGIELVTQTKSGCRSVLDRQPFDREQDAACTSWRAAVLDELRDRPPAVIVLANYADAPIADPGDPAGEWRDGIRSTLSQLPPSSRVVFVADSPNPGSRRTACLSEHPFDALDCAVPRADALGSVPRAAIADAARAAGVPVADVNDYICDATTCPPIIGDTLVYRDENHLTATFAARLAPALDAELAPMLDGLQR